MNPNELKHGRRYQIARAVKNPRLDKRERYNPGLLAWTVGDRFRYDRSPRMVDECLGELDVLSMSATPRRAIGHVGPYHEGWKDLVASLEELPETVRDVLAATGCPLDDGDDLLQALIAKGVITMTTVRQLAEEHRAKIDAEYEAEEKARGMDEGSLKTAERVLAKPEVDHG